MPRIPDQIGPSVQQQAVQLPFARGYQQGAFGPSAAVAASAQATSGMPASFDAFGKIVQELQDKEDTANVLTLENKFKGEVLQLTTDNLGRNGGNASGMRAETAQRFDELKKQYDGQLVNDRQRQAFSKTFESLRYNSVANAASHEVTERDKYIISSSIAGIETDIGLAAANAGDPLAGVIARDSIKQRAFVAARVRGDSSHVAQRFVTASLTSLHTQVLQQLAQDDPSKAADYFERNKGEIDGTKHAELGKQAAEMTRGARVEAAAQTAWTASGVLNDDDKAIELDKIYKDIDKQVTDPEERKRAREQVREMASATKDARKEREETEQSSVMLLYRGGKTLAEISRSPEFAKLSGTKQVRIMRELETIESVKASRLATEANRLAADAARGASNALRADAIAGLGLKQLEREQKIKELEGHGLMFQMTQPDTLARLTEAQIINSRLANTHMNTVLKAKRELSAPANLDNARIDRDMFNNILSRSTGLDVIGIKPGDPKADVIGLAYQRAESAIREAQNKAQQPLSAAVKEQIMREQAELTLRTTGWPNRSIETNVLTLTPANAMRLILPADKPILIERFKKREGFTPTDMQLRDDAYNLLRIRADEERNALRRNVTP